MRLYMDSGSAVDAGPADVEKLAEKLADQLAAQVC